MSETGPRDNKTFDTKVSNLIAATRHLEVSQILLLRRLTLADPESRRWATERQLGIVFNVILAKSIERAGLDKFKEARRGGFQGWTVNGPGREEDIKLLSDMANQMLGPAPMTEAESTQAGFSALLARGPAQAPPKIPRPVPPIKDPPPLFSVQLGSESERSQLGIKTQAMTGDIPDSGVEELPFIDFPTLFDDTICAVCLKNLSLLQVTGPTRGKRLPFLVAPDFAPAFADVLRRFVLPQMRSTRHMQAMANNHNWADRGASRIIAIMQQGEVNNPILHNWDTRWGAFRFSKLKDKKKPEDNPWPTFKQDATRHNYNPPTEEELQLLQDILRMDTDAMEKCWREMVQLHEQEFTPNGRQEPAREGAFRDGLMKWTSKLPDHIGEFFAIRAHFDLSHCDSHFMRRLINNFGRSDAERRRNAPFLSDFVMTLTD